MRVLPAYLSESPGVPVSGLQCGHGPRGLVLLHVDGLGGQGGEDWRVVVGVLHLSGGGRGQEDVCHGEGSNDDLVDDGDTLACNTDCEVNDDNHPM